MTPFLGLNCSFMFGGSCADGAASFSDVDGSGTARAMKFVNSFTFARRRTTFVFGTQDVLELVAAFIVEVASGFRKCAFESVRDSRDKAYSGVWA